MDISTNSQAMGKSLILRALLHTSYLLISYRNPWDPWLFVAAKKRDLRYKGSIRGRIILYGLPVMLSLLSFVII